jgi:hypothetical protein
MRARVIPWKSVGENAMVEAATKFPVKTEEKKVDRPAEWRPFESLRREIDRLFEDFQIGSWRSPFGRTVFDLEPFWRGWLSGVLEQDQNLFDIFRYPVRFRAGS